jgi:hypothetical protein
MATDRVLSCQKANGRMGAAIGNLGADEKGTAGAFSRGSLRYARAALPAHSTRRARLAKNFSKRSSREGAKLNRKLTKRSSFRWVTNSEKDWDHFLALKSEKGLRNSLPAASRGWKVPPKDRDLMCPLGNGYRKSSLHSEQDVGLSLFNYYRRIDMVIGPDRTTGMPDLEGELHPPLKQERWPGIAQNRFDALRQSLLFATNLLHCSGAALAKFFPKALGDATQRPIIAAPLDDDKDFREETYQPMATANECFASLASTITWIKSPNYSLMQWLGWCQWNWH